MNNCCGVSPEDLSVLDYFEPSSITGDGKDKSGWTLLKAGTALVSFPDSTTRLRGLTEFDTENQIDKAGYLTIEPVTGGVKVLDSQIGDAATLGRTVASGTWVGLYNANECQVAGIGGSVDCIVRLYKFANRSR